MKTYNITLQEPTIKAEYRSISISLNETKTIDDYTIKLTNIIQEPTSEITGSGIITTINKYGREASQSVTIAKIKE